MSGFQMVDHTDLLRMRRRVYRLGDIRLPVPIAGTQAVAALIGLFLSRTVLGLVGVRFTLGSSFWFIAPVVAGWFLMKDDQIEGRSAARYLVARIRWVTTPRVIVGVM